MIATFTITWADGSTWCSGGFDTSYGDEPLFHAQEKLRERVSQAVIDEIVGQIHATYGTGKSLDLTTDTPWHASYGGVELSIVAR